MRRLGQLVVRQEQAVFGEGIEVCRIQPKVLAEAVGRLGQVALLLIMACASQQAAGVPPHLVGVEEVRARRQNGDG